MKEVKSYVANDGACFSSMQDCLNYEKQNGIEKILNIMEELKNFCFENEGCDNCLLGYFLTNKNKNKDKDGNIEYKCFCNMSQPWQWNKSEILNCIHKNKIK